MPYLTNFMLNYLSLQEMFGLAPINNINIETFDGKWGKKLTLKR